MIPVLGIPVINRPDLLRACLASLDEPVGRLIVIDNSGTGELGDAAHAVRPDALIVDPPSNLGVAASWNFVIRTSPAAPWWCLLNADTELGGGDLGRLAAEMETSGARWVGMNGDWRVFGLNAAAVETVGLFDEGFHPCYFEDCDYEWRCTVAGVPWYTIPGQATHAGSAAIHSDPRLGEANARSYPRNAARYREKWGGGHRGGEVYRTPWNRGGHLGDWRLEIERVREQAWS